MSKKKKPSFNFEHYVDDENDVIYVESRGWAGTLAATTQVKKYYPDHKINIVKPNFIKEMKSDA